MTFDFDWKTLTSFLISIVLLLVQYLSGVYDGGVTGLEWFGLLLVLFGPAGVVAAVNNTTYSPATKALVQHVSTVVIVVVQGVQGVYSGGITQTEWFGLALLLLSTLAVYFAPPKHLSAIR